MILKKVLAISKGAKLEQLARQIGREVFETENFSEAIDIIEKINPDLILTDHTFGRNFLNTPDKFLVNTPLVVVGDGKQKSDLRTKFLQLGALEYLQTADDYEQIQEIATQIKKSHQPFEEDTKITDFFSEELARSVNLVGKSPAIQNELKMIKLLANSQCNPILITGETGTGKELAAKAIHNLKHPDEPFVAVNCAALTANLLESELFGHVKGSFTSADREKTGLLELAGSGTIFLDEISEMPLDLQAKLLRVLQEKTFRKVGGVKQISCSATIIASSNRNLYQQAQLNHFRKDLYYRLSICPIIIPPLRAPERQDDIKLLAQYFLETSNICPQKKNQITKLTKLTIEALEKHDWPGNVRELHNIIERAILLETTDKIGLSSIIINPTEFSQSPLNSAENKAKDFSLEKAEKELIARALKETGWQKTRAAGLLGITRATLYAKVKQYNIQEKQGCTEQENQTDEAMEELMAPSAA